MAAHDDGDDRANSAEPDSFMDPSDSDVLYGGTNRLFSRVRESWTPEELERVRERLVDFLRATWRSTYEPLVYEAVGIAEPYALVAELREHPACRERRRELSAGCLDFFLREEILDAEVQP